jgi:hypothetical protein
MDSVIVSMADRDFTIPPISFHFFWFAFVEEGVQIECPPGSAAIRQVGLCMACGPSLHPLSKHFSFLLT